MIEDDFILLKIPEYIKLASNLTTRIIEKVINTSVVATAIEKEVRNKNRIETTLTGVEDTYVENFKKTAGDVVNYLKV